MIENYPKSNQLNQPTSRPSTKRQLTFLAILAFFALTAIDTNAQQYYTVGTGGLDSSTLGVTPFSTSNRDSRSQYIYLYEELINQGASSGNITELSLNITSLALPTSLKPENVSIKMGSTFNVVLGDAMVENLPVYYTAAIIPINNTGWFTIVLDTPFEWDGSQNIIIEICRDNEMSGTSYGVQSSIFGPTDYRTTGLWENDNATPGCSLTGITSMIVADRRTRPNMRFTMTDPCTGTPTAGVTTVSSAAIYCNGSAFTLSVQNGATESNLAYQWQWAYNSNGPWYNVTGAYNTAYTTTQSIATWYRRATTCLNSSETIFSFPLEVGGTGCYCTAQVSNDNAIGITNVSFNTIDNTSPSTPQYTNFTGVQTTVNREETYNLSAAVTTMGGANYTTAWIDWNNNGNYEASESYNLGTVTGGTAVNSGTIASVTVPANAVLGVTKMRVRTMQSAANDYPAACGLIENGEAEDYSLLIDPALSIGDFNANTVDILAYGINGGLKVDARNTTLTSVMVYDISGRLLASVADLNNTTTSLPLQAKGQIVIVKVTTVDGATINKKVLLQTSN